MKKAVIAIAASTALATAAGSAIAGSNHYSKRNSSCYKMHPYLGIEYKYHHMGPKEDWKKLLPDDFHGATVYLGERFHENWGVEIGYSHSANNKRTVNLNTTDGFFNTGITAAFTNKAKVRVSSYQFDLNGYYPVGHDISLVGSLGIAGMKAKARLNSETRNAQSTNLASIEHKRRAIARAGFGAEWTRGRFGIRGILRWEGSDRLRVKKNTLARSFPTASDKYYKDSFSLNVGGNIQFL